MTRERERQNKITRQTEMEFSLSSNVVSPSRSSMLIYPLST